MNIVTKILSLEVTEDCNLCCRHCMNGTKYKINMSDEVIRKVFSKVKVVEELLLTGGEVFLAYETVKRILEIAKEMNVEIGYCVIVTNACIYDQRIYDLLDEYFGDEYYIYISNDDYHDKSIIRTYTSLESSNDPEREPKNIYEVRKNMVKNMEGRHFVDFQNLGNKLINVGRAKNMPGDKHEFEVMGYFYDYYKNMLLVGPVLYVSALGYVTEGNDEISHYKDGSLGNILNDDLVDIIVSGGIRVPCKSLDEFMTFLERRKEEYHSLKGEHYIIEDGKMRVVEIRKSNLAEEEIKRFLNFLEVECKDGVTLEKLLTYDFSRYPYDLSLVDHLE